MEVDGLNPAIELLVTLYDASNYMSYFGEEKEMDRKVKGIKIIAVQ